MYQLRTPLQFKGIQNAPECTKVSLRLRNTRQLRAMYRCLKLIPKPASSYDALQAAYKCNHDLRSASNVEVTSA
eukprot:6204505-Pleurochrysis_carterae.AAC.4